MRKRLMTFGAVAMALAFVAAGCDDDDNGNEAEGGGGDVQAYCDLGAQLDEQDGPPSEAQIEELRDVAPDEISEEIDFVAGRYLEDGPSVFGDPEVGERFDVIEEYEVEACGREPEDEDGGGDAEPAEGAQVVEVVGTEYAFEGVPETVPAGPVAFRLTNEGEEEHELALGKLVEGKTMEDVLAVEGDPVEAGVVEELLGNVWTPGGETSGYLNVELEPGTYGFVCFVPSAEDGQPHAAHGMTATFTVA